MTPEVAPEVTPEARPEATQGGDAESLKLTCQLTPKGYRAVLLHLAALRLRFVTPLLAFLGFSALAGGFTTQAVFLLGTLFAIAVTTWGYIAWNVSSPSNVELYLPVAYEFDDTGVIFAGPAGTGQIAWDRIRRWRLAADHYLMYIAGATYIIVSATDITVDDDTQLEALLRAHVRKGPRRLR